MSLICAGKLLPELIHTDHHLDGTAVARRDLATADARQHIAYLLRSRNAIFVASGVYGIPRLLSPSTYPPEHICAAAIAHQNGWRLGIPLSVARYMVGIAERPISASEIPYDQDSERAYKRVGLRLIPGDKTVLGMTPAGQAVALGLPSDVSLPGIHELAINAEILRSEPVMKSWLQEDLAAGRLKDHQEEFARVVLRADPSEFLTRAPTTFTPPDTPTASIDRWRIVVKPGRPAVLSARKISGHPSICDGDSLEWSSPLIWIDERQGWARTRSRLYRLEKKDDV